MKTNKSTTAATLESGRSFEELVRTLGETNRADVPFIEEREEVEAVFARFVRAISLYSNQDIRIINGSVGLALTEYVEELEKEIHRRGYYCQHALNEDGSHSIILQRSTMVRIDRFSEDGSRQSGVRMSRHKLCEEIFFHIVDNAQAAGKTGDRALVAWYQGALGLLIQQWHVGAISIKEQTLTLNCSTEGL